MIGFDANKVGKVREETDQCYWMMGRRWELVMKIEDAINNHGGSITVHDTIDLQLAKNHKLEYKEV